jgi:hypothetical protein
MLAGGIGLGIWASSTASQEKSSTDPNDKPNLRDAAQTRAILADVAFGAAAHLFGAGLVVRLAVERPQFVGFSPSGIVVGSGF